MVESGPSPSDKGTNEEKIEDVEVAFAPLDVAARIILSPIRIPIHLVLKSVHTMGSLAALVFRRRPPELPSPSEPPTAPQG